MMTDDHLLGYEEGSDVLRPEHHTVKHYLTKISDILRPVSRIYYSERLGGILDLDPV